MTRREQVLRWVNRERAKCSAQGSGHEPLDDLPAGIPKDPNRCVLANALPHAESVDPHGEYISLGHPMFELVGGGSEEMPKYVAEFAEAFDEGRYPDLIEKESS